MNKVAQTQVSSYKWLIILLITAGISVLISNQFGARMNVWAFAIISAGSLGALVIFSTRIVLVAKSKQDRIIGLVFATFSILLFTAEQIGNIYYNLILDEEQFPSIADAFYLAAFTVLAAFVFLLTHPFRKFITKKIFFSSIALAASYLIPSIILTINTDDSSFNVFVSALYPIIDAIILVPLIYAFVVFYGIKQNYLWLVLAAIIMEIATDTGFLFLEISGTNYTGHPIWLGFEWANILLAYGAYRQSIVMKRMPISVTTQLNVGIERINRTSTIVLTPLLISSAVLIFVFSFMAIYDFRDLSTTELAFFEPIIYAGLIAIVSITAVIMFIARKTSSLEAKIQQDMKSVESVDVKRDEYITTTNEILGLEKKIQRIDNVGKYSIKSIIIIGIIVAIGTGYFAYTNYYEQLSPSQLQTKYIVENLKGDIVKTWVAWRLTGDEPLHITILNTDLVSADKINTIKNAILSEETVEIPNVDVGKKPDDGTGTYYLGWAGALKKAAENNPEINIPTNLHVDISNKPKGDIVIVLTNLKEADGTLGFTKSIADDHQSQILKSTITIFDATDLDTHELDAIIRHEFGHALGLGHSTAREDLMFSTFNSKYAYISDCDVDSITSLYDKRGSPAVVCEN